MFLCDASLVLRAISGVVSTLSTYACCSVVVLPVLPVDKLFKRDAVGVALSADVHCLQDPRVAQLHHHPLLAETQCLPVIIGLDAADKVWLTHHHLRQQVHQGVLRTHNETTINSGQRQDQNTREEISREFTLSVWWCEFSYNALNFNFKHTTFSRYRCV